MIIGKDASHVKREDAFEYVFGYTVINDVSARNVQTRHKQWYFGKSMDGFTPMGPFIVTEDVVKRPRGSLYQKSGERGFETAQQYRPFYFRYSPCDQRAFQRYGAEGRNHHIYGNAGRGRNGNDSSQILMPGDVVKCDVEGIGMITNIVV